jgi:hypothetical protein
VPVTPVGAVQPIGGGWRIDGDAWLLLDLPADRPLPIQVTLIAEGDGDPLTMSVVRRVGDRGVGIATRSEPPYRLAAPRVTVVRVSGHGVVDDEVRVGFAMAPELEASQGVALGLPAGMLGDDPASPRYLGQDPDGSQAWQRVQEAAPGAVAPHERWDAPAIAPSPDDEVERVRALTHGWLEATLADLLALPVEQRPDLQRPQPHLGLGAGARPVTAAVSPLDALLTAAAVDPGLARWLGLAWLAPDPQPDGRNDLVLVTVAGRWGMPRSRLADMMAMLGDPGTVAAHLQAVGCDDQLSLTDGAPHTVVDLWAQAVVSRSAPPDPPPALVLHADLAPRWLSRPPGAARQSLRLDGVAPLGQVGVARVGADAQPVPLAGTVDPPGRARPQAATDGAVLTDQVEAPDGTPLDYRAWQADLFGRWGPESTAQAPPPARPALPVPDPQVWVREPAAPPAGEQPFSTSVWVRVPVPSALPGQPPVTRVTVRLAGTTPVTSAVQAPDTVVLEADGPPTTRTEPVRRAALTVHFTADDGSSSQSLPLTLTFTDPRPPVPAPVPAALRFSSRGDASGRAALALDLPVLAGVTGWHIYLTSETSLRRAGVPGPEPGGVRDARASQWLAGADAWSQQRFECLTPTPVAPPTYLLELPGDLAEIAFVRLVPVGAGGGTPPFGQCPTQAVAVPWSVAPAPPDLEAADDDALSVRITARPGRVPAAAYRLRMGPDDTAALRSLPIVAEGPLDADGSVVTLPALRPFARVQVVAEVQGEAEAGNPPSPGMWSAASAPLHLLRVPADPVDAGLTTVLAADGPGLRLDATVTGLPRPLPPGFRLRVLRRPSDGPPVVTDVPLVDGEPPHATLALPADGGDLFVSLVDPLDRSSSPARVVPA